MNKLFISFNFLPTYRLKHNTVALAVSQAITITALVHGHIEGQNNYYKITAIYLKKL